MYSGASLLLLFQHFLDAETEELEFETSLGYIFRDSNFTTLNRCRTESRTGDVIQLIECFPSTHKALGLSSINKAWLHRPVVQHLGGRSSNIRSSRPSWAV